MSPLCLAKPAYELVCLWRPSIKDSRVLRLVLLVKRSYRSSAPSFKGIVVSTHGASNLGLVSCKIDCEILGLLELKFK